MAAVVAAVRAKETARGKDAVLQDVDARKFVTSAARQSLKNSWSTVPYFEPLVLARTRAVETEVRNLLVSDKTILQAVSLGAGYSTLMERMTRLPGIRLSTFECDRPERLERKKECIGRHYAPVPVMLDLIEDINRLKRSLKSVGFNQMKRSVFVMEGLLYYFPSPHSIVRLLEGVRDLCGTSGGLLVFDTYTRQAERIHKDVRGNLKSSGLRARFESPSTWVHRLERLGFTLRKFTNIAWIDEWKRLRAYRSQVSSCLFVAEFQRAVQSSSSGLH